MFIQCFRDGGGGGGEGGGGGGSVTAAREGAKDNLLRWNSYDSKLAFWPWRQALLSLPGICNFPESPD